MSTVNDGNTGSDTTSSRAPESNPGPEPIDAGTLQRFADGMPDPIFFKDRQHRWVAFNRAFCDLVGRPASELVGKSDPDYFPPDQVAVFWKHDDMVFSTGKGDLNEEQITRSDGTARVLWTRKSPVFGKGGAVVGLCGIIMDITDHKAQIREVERLAADANRQKAIIEAQQRTIDELVVPVLEVWQGILLLPLVGALSRSRAEHAVDSVLRAVGAHGAETVIIDVTGAAALDGEVAELLVRAIRAIALLGCRSMLVGISPAAAQTLVSGGADLGGIKTCATLKQGLALALEERRAYPAR